MPVREADLTRDRRALADLVVTLQNLERQFDPLMPEGVAMVDAYLEVVLARCRKWDGKIFVAEDGGEISGFVCVWAKVPSEEPDDDPSDYGFISDLVVAQAHRRRGVGRELMGAAEDYVRARGIRRLRLQVMARNTIARAFYDSMNYGERTIELEKCTDPRPPNP